jgi:hypothetical protein
MHGAAQKASKPGETVAQDSFTKRNRFPFPTWTGGSLSFFEFFSFFDCFPSFPFFLFCLSLFFDLLDQGTGMAATERRRRDGCVHEVADG